MSEDFLVTPGSSATQKKRKRRFAYALSAGGMSKLLAVTVQLLALPLALGALGTERYAAFLALQAFLGWTGLLGLGLIPTLPRFIAEAHANGNVQTERDLIQAVGVFMAGLFVVLVSALFILAASVPPARLIAVHGVATAEVTAAYTAAVIVTGLQFSTSIIPAIRSGYQELHYTYVWSSIASVAVGLSLLHISSGKPTIAVFVLVLYVPLSVLMLVDAVVITFQKPYLAKGRPDLGKAARILLPHAANALATQVEFFLVSYLPTLIVAHLKGPEATTIFGSTLQLLVLACSGMNLIFQPLLPAIANAHAHRDWIWMRRAYFHAALIIAAICSVGIAVNIACGAFLIQKWLHTSLKIPTALPIIAAIYFTFWMMSLLNFNVLAATGNLLRIGRVYVIEGFLGITLGTVLSYFYGINGMMLGLLVATVSVSGWYMPLQVWRRVLRHSASSGN